MPVFYPACTVNVRLRFDSSFRVDPIAAELAGDKDALKEHLALTAGARLTEPLVLSGPRGQLSTAMGITPRSCSVEMPGMRTAGRFSVTADFRTIPIDPRLIKGAGVTILLGTVPDYDFADGMARAKPSGARSSRLDIDSAGLAIQFAGIIDDWEVTHGASGSEISFSGRDLRAILMDSPARPEMFEDVDLTQDIGLVVADILAKHPMLYDQVPLMDDGWPDNTIPSPGDTEGLTRVMQGADGKAKGRRGSKGGGNDLNFWDLIVQYCMLVGAVPYYIGNTMHIRSARTLYQRQAAGNDPARNPTPFAGGLKRHVPGQAEPISQRQFLYGRDVEEISFKRKFTGKKATAVQVVCLNTSSKERGAAKLLSATWPPGIEVTNGGKGKKTTVKATDKRADRATTTSVGPSNQVSAKDIMRIPVSGIRSEKRLQAIANAIYEEVNRGEMGGSVQTKKLASFGGDNNDADLLKMRAGDAVLLATDSAPMGNVPIMAELTKQARHSFEEQVQYVAAQIGDEQAARAIVATARGAVVELQQWFYVTEVSFDWDAGSGIDVNFSFINYVEPVMDFSSVEAAKADPAAKKKKKLKAVKKRAKAVKKVADMPSIEDGVAEAPSGQSKGKVGGKGKGSSNPDDLDYWG